MKNTQNWVFFGSQIFTVLLSAKFDAFCV